MYGNVPEDQYIYIRRPAVLTNADMPATKRLRKCPYVLPHAPVTFRTHSDAALQSLRFAPTTSDPLLYVKLNVNGTKVYIVVHVDNLGIHEGSRRSNHGYLSVRGELEC